MMLLSRPLRIVVIGGGAAGFFGAIAVAEANPDAQVTLLEAGRLLAKVRVSGGGRCNVTHACFDPAILVQHYPRGGKALRGPLSCFHARHTVDWFANHGVQLKTEPDGRMFPITDSSVTIVDCLLEAAETAGVKIRTGAVVTHIAHKVGATVAATSHTFSAGTGNTPTAVLSAEHVMDPKSWFEIQLKSGEVLLSDRILLATGSSAQGYQLAQSLGHQIKPPVPSLFTFNVPDERLQGLAGLATPVHLRLATTGDKLEQTGPLVITHWGLSGPAVLKLSAWGARVLHDSDYQAMLQINWLPQHNPETLRQELLQIKSNWSRRAIAASCPVSLPRRLWQRLVASVGIQPTVRWAELSNKILSQLIQELTQGRYLLKGKGVFKEEFVTCGGINLKEVNFQTMESRCCPGLYFAGEILDIDGVTGGFNFQSAWTTAWLAGQAMGQA